MVTTMLAIRWSRPIPLPETSAMVSRIWFGGRDARRPVLYKLCHARSACGSRAEYSNNASWRQGRDLPRISAKGAQPDPLVSELRFQFLMPSFHTYRLKNAPFPPPCQHAGLAGLLRIRARIGQAGRIEGGG